MLLADSTLDNRQKISEKGRKSILSKDKDKVRMLHFLILLRTRTPGQHNNLVFIIINKIIHSFRHLKIQSDAVHLTED